MSKISNGQGQGKSKGSIESKISGFEQRLKDTLRRSGKE